MGAAFAEACAAHLPKERLCTSSIHADDLYIHINIAG